MEKDTKLIEQKIDGVRFKLKEKTDFSFLKRFGQVFCVFDQNDSGNISFGIINEIGEKFFVKVAGAKTAESFREPEEAVTALKKTVKIYEKLRCESLINILTSGTFQKLFFIVFHWSKGDCLFDHWNFDLYRNHSEIKSPKEKFMKLELSAKLKVASQILSFMEFVEANGYVAVDFYDGSLMYDFENQQLTICDIDFFEKGPSINEIGSDYWGTKRMKAPEEYQMGAVIDSKTNVFTVGALFFHIFGEYSKEVIETMYRENRFIPLTKQNWQLSSQLYKVVLKAVRYTPQDRYQSIKDLRKDWLSNC